ncbi:MAG: stage IV sporulation protein A [Clostridiales bacterium GWF2_38_85]|nr:MAG: stage IV sporulation protein A [Clostridiales bacterium GWF2_38_85]HBL84115.1 stage IV sporulation protein A [Clostridiales bacterium]
MTSTSIYQDIATRTGGDIYIGVVGPVRTGKSTLIKKFMETLVIPNIANEYNRTRAQDEMPQSAAGKTVMTTEPKFVPDEAVTVTLANKATFDLRMIDCVGYIVPGAIGHIEDGVPRMVMTPWSNEEMPFEQAAEIGTRKVINDHSTIGILVTTDGSIGEIPRSSYVAAEKRVVDELTAINKPFIIVLNSATPNALETINLATDLEERYGVPVALLDCLDLNDDDIKHIIELILFEFPISELGINMPGWIDVLPEDHYLRRQIYDGIMSTAQSIRKVGEIQSHFDKLNSEQQLMTVKIENISLGDGKALAEVKLPESMFYKVLGELVNYNISDERELISIFTELASAKKKYDKVAAALDQVNETGYGIVAPTIDDLKLEEPEIVKQSGGYGVRLKASAPSIHMIRANIETEVSPIVGTAQQSEELVRFLLQEFEEDPKKIWGSNMFGKSLHELVGEGLNTKLAHMPDDARVKLSKTLQRIINEGSGGLICILL